MKFLLAIALGLFLVLEAQAQTTFWASSGVGAGAVTPGNDNNNCTARATPCLTLDAALAKFRAVNGYNGAGGVINLLPGDYDSKGFKSGNVTTLPSGTDLGAGAFTIKAVDGDRTVRIIREDRFGPITRTVTEMQSPVCTSPISGETNLDCLGAPTLAECTARGWGAGYPASCWNGAPSPTYLYLRLNRSGGDFHGSQNLSGPLIELYGLSESASNNVKYVVFDGLIFDGRGLALNIFQNTTSWAHTMWGQYLKFKNGAIRNSAGSCFAQPDVGDIDMGVDEGSPYGNTYRGISWEHSAIWNGSAWVSGPRHKNYWYFEGTLANPYIIEKCGIPFNTYVVSGQTGGLTARLHPEAKFLHGWYTALGGNECNYCELRFAAGNSAGAEGEDNVIRNSYIHSSAISGHYITGERTIIENTVFTNNNGAAGYELHVFASRQGVFRNNTFIAGTNSGYNAIYINDRSYDGNIIENNIFYGYTEPILNASCQYSAITNDCSFGNAYPRSIIRNNIAYKPGTTYTAIGRDIANPVLPATYSNNIINQDPLLTNVPNDLTIASNSPAKDVGYNNGLTVDRLGNTRPFGAGIDMGAFEYCTGGACTAAPTTATLSVIVSGATAPSITRTGGTNCNLTSPQSAPFNLVCDIGSTLSLVAPSPGPGGATFSSWTGCTTTTTVTCNVTLASGMTVTANYGTTKTLTISALNVTVPPTITVTPNDSSGNGNGTTTFFRAYATGTSVTATAPGNIGSTYFLNWSGCDSTSGFGGVTCLVTMATDKAISANYGGDGCGVDKDNLTIGVTVTLCSTTNVRDAANGNTIGSQSGGAVGVIIGGPTSGGGVEWVQTDFATGVDGWTTRRNLAPAASGGGPTPAPKVLFGGGIRVGSGVSVGN